MELFLQILLKEIENGNIQITLSEEAAKVVQSKAFFTLEQIRDVVCDDSLSDPECFWKIEKIVETLEELGSNGGVRHDFG